MEKTELIQVNLSELLSVLGEEEVRKEISSFSCEKNKDVENFLRNKAILFAQQGLAKTHLVYWVNREEERVEKELVGYYALAPKEITMQKNALSKGVMKRIRKFHVGEDDDKIYRIPAILIGQFGKNDANGNDLLISGSELMRIALEKVRRVQNEIGGKIVYLECEDNPKLIAFYESNGFQSFGKRELDRDEVTLLPVLRSG